MAAVLSSQAPNGRYVLFHNELTRPAARSTVCASSHASFLLFTFFVKVPSVNFENQSADWFKGLSSCLGWNNRERQKAMETAAALASTTSSATVSRKTSITD